MFNTIKSVHNIFKFKRIQTKDGDLTSEQATFPEKSPLKLNGNSHECKNANVDDIYSQMEHTSLLKQSEALERQNLSLKQANADLQRENYELKAEINRQQQEKFQSAPGNSFEEITRLFSDFEDLKVNA